MFDDFPKTRPPLPEERRSQPRSDRITSVATFEHVCNLRVSIPSEGTPLGSLAWSLTTGLEFRPRHRLDHGLLRKHEHIDSAREIEGRLRYLFCDVTGSVLGLSRGVSLYQFYQCAGPDLNRCRGYLETIAAPN